MMGDVFILLTFVGPIAASLLSTYLFYLGFRRGILRWPIILSFMLFASVVGEVYWLSSLGGMGGMAAGAVCLPVALVALIGAAALTLTSPHRLKASAIVLFPVLPGVLLISSIFGSDASPENQTERHAKQIIQSLQAFKGEFGRYPHQLGELSPSFLDPIPEAATTQGTGWLYTATDDQFVFGYWRWPVKFGSNVCLFDSAQGQWHCEFNKWEPFEPVYTPMP